MKQKEQQGQGAFVDALINKFGLKNDAALARVLEVAPPVISKVRHDQRPVGAALILKIHEKLQMPVAAIRRHLAGAA